MTFSPGASPTPDQFSNVPSTRRGTEKPIERQSFDEHLATLRWDQGDHIVIAGPTKSGKSTLGARLAEKRSHVVSMVIKRRDSTMDTEYRNWRRYEEWPKHGPPGYDRRILLWPRPEKTLAATLAKQRYIFTQALDQIDQDGNRAVVIDEGVYFCEAQMLNLGKQLSMMFYTGRSNGLSMGLWAQRPAWIPKIIRSSTTHAWVARTRDRDDLKTLSELAGMHAKRVEQQLIRLPVRQDYVYMNPQGDSPPRIINTRK